MSKYIHIPNTPYIEYQPYKTSDRHSHNRYTQATEGPYYSEV